MKEVKNVFLWSLGILAVAFVVSNVNSVGFLIKDTEKDDVDIKRLTVQPKEVEILPTLKKQEMEEFCFEGARDAKGCYTSFINQCIKGREDRCRYGGTISSRSQKEIVHCKITGETCSFYKRGRITNGYECKCGIKDGEYTQ